MSNATPCQAAYILWASFRAWGKTKARFKRPEISDPDTSDMAFFVSLPSVSPDFFTLLATNKVHSKKKNKLFKNKLKVPSTFLKINSITFSTKKKQFSFFQCPTTSNGRFDPLHTKMHPSNSPAPFMYECYYDNDGASVLPFIKVKALSLGDGYKTHACYPCVVEPFCRGGLLL